jgi:hypothetical protein
MRRLLVRVVLPLIVFTALAIVWSFPLVLHLSDRLPGQVAGDNLSFLWNLWWMRRAGPGFFYTPMLFAPFGADLALHTHTALQGAIGATVLRSLDVVAAQNVIIIGTLALNGLAAYLLALDRTDDPMASMIAGLVFGGSPYVAAHLLGHFNLISVWTLPLFALCVLRTFERRSLTWSCVTGICLVATAYTDYYYAVYALVIVCGLLLRGTGLVRISAGPRPLSARATLLIGATMALIGAAIAAILLGGGFDGSILGVRVRAADPGNLLSAAWLVIATAAWLRLRPSVGFDLSSGTKAIARRVTLLLPAGIVFVFGIFPLAVHIVTIWSAGDYLAPTHLWRSGPSGVDAATLLLGNPFHPWIGPWTTAAYARLDIDRIEGMGWLGIVPTTFMLWAIARAGARNEFPSTLAGGLLFLVWALGPWLKVAGLNTGLMLPANVFGLIPILSNARMPGRAIVVTVLAAALLGARLIASSPRPFRRRLACAAAVLLVIDYLPAPFPLIPTGVPRLYASIPGGGTGSVLELPMGLRDGLEQQGAFDDRTLEHQMVHGRPLVGGFSARIAPSIKEGYARMPVIRSLLRLSDRSIEQPDPQDALLNRAAAASALRAASVQFVVLDRAQAPPRLIAFVHSMLPLTLLQTDGMRDLFSVPD